MQLEYELTYKDKIEFIKELKAYKKQFFHFLGLNLSIHLIPLLISSSFWNLFNYIIFDIDIQLKLIIIEVLLIFIIYILTISNNHILSFVSSHSNCNSKIKITDEFITIQNKNTLQIIKPTLFLNVFETNNYYGLICGICIVIPKKMLETDETKNIYSSVAEKIKKIKFPIGYLFMICALSFICPNIESYYKDFKYQKELEQKNFIVREFNHLIIDENSKEAELGLETNDILVEINGYYAPSIPQKRLERMLKWKNVKLKVYKRNVDDVYDYTLNAD